MKHPAERPLKLQICERLKQARQSVGFGSAKAFALAKGLKISTYSLHEAGTRAMSFDVIEHYCDLLDINPSWLLTGVRSELRASIASMWNVPILEWEEILLFPDKVELSQKKWTTSDTDLSTPSFAVRVIDNSMAPRYPRGTLLLIDLTQIPIDREYGLFALDKETVSFKQLISIKEEWHMRSLNPDYPSQKITEGIDILGKVVQAKLKC